MIGSIPESHPINADHTRQKTALSDWRRGRFSHGLRSPDTDRILRQKRGAGNFSFERVIPGKRLNEIWAALMDQFGGLPDTDDTSEFLYPVAETMRWQMVNRGQPVTAESL